MFFFMMSAAMRFFSMMDVVASGPSLVSGGMGVVLAQISFAPVALSCFTINSNLSS